MIPEKLSRSFSASSMRAAIRFLAGHSVLIESPFACPTAVPDLRWHGSQAFAQKLNRRKSSCSGEAGADFRRRSGRRLGLAP